MKNVAGLLFLVLTISQCRQKEVRYSTLFPGKPEVPSTIQKEHDYLLNQFQKIISLQESTDSIALKVNELMQHHFQEEEDFVLPALGLLPALADGQIPGQREEIIQLTEKVKEQLAHMSAEHQLIKSYMNELKQGAQKDNLPEIIEFEQALHKHAATEEEIYFPSAILIGEYLKLKPK